jgi:hypothetical protein
MTARSVETLLQAVVDYAGMFPPARLPLDEAVAMYMRHRAGEHAWMMGTFVIPAERLGDLDSAWARITGGRQLSPGHPDTCPISVIVPSGSPAAIEHVARAGSRMTIVAIEFGPFAPDQMAELAAAVPDRVQAFFEVAPDGHLDHRLDAVAACGGFAKIRTGGMTPDAFPSAQAVYRFLRGCADRRLSAKATAGLHHAVAGRYPLTDEPGSASAPMYGFLNMCAAAALVHAGAAEEDVLEALGETSPAAFRFDDEGMRWRDRWLPTGDLKATRQTLFRSFGSCSVHEAIDELTRMRAL